MADVDQSHDDENCEGDFHILCISDQIVMTMRTAREIFLFRVFLNE